MCTAAFSSFRHLSAGIGTFGMQGFLLDIDTGVAEAS